MTTPHKDLAPLLYRITLKGYIDQSWSHWFDQMAISNESGASILTGQVADQSSLHGLLNRIRDLNLTLISVERIDSNQQVKKPA
jgi:hypothetical protein